MAHFLLQNRSITAPFCPAMQKIRNKPIQLTRLLAPTLCGWSPPLAKPATNGARTDPQSLPNLFVLEPCLSQQKRLLIEPGSFFSIDQSPLQSCWAVASQGLIWFNGRRRDKRSSHVFPLARGEAIQMCDEIAHQMKAIGHLYCMGKRLSHSCLRMEDGVRRYGETSLLIYHGETYLPNSIHAACRGHDCRIDTPPMICASLLRKHFELRYLHAFGQIVAGPSFRFQHCGETSFPNQKGTGPMSSVRYGETYLPNAANLIYNPHCRKLFRAITRTQLNRGMLTQPSSYNGNGSLFKQGNGAMTFEVDHNGSIAGPFLPRPLVQSTHPWRLGLSYRLRMKHSEECARRGL
jgi:hypothetical protein